MTRGGGGERAHFPFFCLQKTIASFPFRPPAHSDDRRRRLSIFSRARGGNFACNSPTNLIKSTDLGTVCYPKSALFIFCDFCNCGYLSFPANFARLFVLVEKCEEKFSIHQLISSHITFHYSIRILSRESVSSQDDLLGAHDFAWPPVFAQDFCTVLFVLTSKTT
jgi:hypothetical protein